MILDEKIKIKGNPRNLKYFKNLNYDIKINEYVDVEIKDLFKNSHVKVNVKCDICEIERIITYFSYVRNIGNDNLYTCPVCSKIKSKKTSIIRYGVEYAIQSDVIKQKRKENNIDKYGVDEPAKLNVNIQKTKNTKKIKYDNENYVNFEKIKETKRIKYGDENYNNREKCEKTCLEIYGVSNVFQNENIKNKKIDTYIINYGVDNYSKSKIFKDIKNNFTINKYKNINIIDSNDNIVTLKCDQNENHTYNVNKYILRNRIIYNTILCTVCNPISSSMNSGYEIQLRNYIKENYSGEIILNSRNIINNELDIYLPELKLAFEFNGLYWHSEIKKEKNYHLNKTEDCEKKGIELIHIYDDDWLYKQDIIKSLILYKLNKIPIEISAENCEIIEIKNNKIVKDFLENNHLQGFTNSSIKIGIFHNKELLFLMTFIKKNEIYELLRICNKINLNVIDGTYKLFKYFLDNYKPKNIITTINRSFNQIELYNSLGFKLIEKTTPNCYYIINKKRKSKKDHSTKKLYKIYDSGNLKFIY